MPLINSLITRIVSCSSDFSADKLTKVTNLHDAIPSYGYFCFTDTLGLHTAQIRGV